MPATPVAVPLDKVPMGTWAEYTIKRGNDNARKQRYALVGKDAGAFVIESKGETGQGEKVLTRTVVAADPTAEGAVKKVVTQFGDGDPMEMPAGGMGRPGGPGDRERVVRAAGPPGQRRRPRRSGRWRARRTRAAAAACGAPAS